MHLRQCRCDWCGKLWQEDVIEICSDCRSAGMTGPRPDPGPSEVEAHIYAAIAELYRACKQLYADRLLERDAALAEKPKAPTQDYCP